jgi:hypothetical protein
MKSLYMHTLSMPFKQAEIHWKKFFLRNFQNVSSYAFLLTLPWYGGSFCRLAFVLQITP